MIRCGSAIDLRPIQRKTKVSVMFCFCFVVCGNLALLLGRLLIVVNGDGVSINVSNVSCRALVLYRRCPPGTRSWFGRTAPSALMATTKQQMVGDPFCWGFHTPRKSQQSWFHSPFHSHTCFIEQQKGCVKPNAHQSRSRATSQTPVVLGALNGRRRPTSAKLRNGCKSSLSCCCVGFRFPFFLTSNLLHLIFGQPCRTFFRFVGLWPTWTKLRGKNFTHINTRAFFEVRPHKFWSTMLVL